MELPIRTPIPAPKTLSQILLIPPPARIDSLALYIQEQIVAATHFATSQPNNEALWAQLRLTVTDLLQSLFHQGAFAGASSTQAFFVRCDTSTTTQTDIELGHVQIIVGFAVTQGGQFTILHIGIQTQPGS